MKKLKLIINILHGKPTIYRVKFAPEVGVMPFHPSNKNMMCVQCEFGQ